MLKRDKSWTKQEDITENHGGTNNSNIGIWKICRILYLTFLTNVYIFISKI